MVPLRVSSFLTFGFHVFSSHPSVRKSSAYTRAPVPQVPYGSEINFFPHFRFVSDGFLNILYVDLSNMFSSRFLFHFNFFFLLFIVTSQNKIFAYSVEGTKSYLQMEANKLKASQELRRHNFRKWLEQNAV